MVRDNRDLVLVTPSEVRDGDHMGDRLRRTVVGSPRKLPGGRRVEIDVRWGNGRREVIRPEADRLLRVRRAVVGTGLPLRHRSKSRTTGGIVEVYDTLHADSTIAAHQAQGHQWAMRCEHGTVRGRRTLKSAIEDVCDPRLWCTRCVEAGPGALPLF